MLSNKEYVLVCRQLSDHRPKKRNSGYYSSLLPKKETTLLHRSSKAQLEMQNWIHSAMNKWTEDGRNYGTEK